MELEIDSNLMKIIGKELTARKSNSCTILGLNNMVPKLGPKRANRMPSPMNLLKKNDKFKSEKKEGEEELEFSLSGEKDESKDKTKNKEYDLNEIILCNSDDEHDPALFQLKLDDSERSPRKRKTLKMDSKILDNDDSDLIDNKSCSTNNLLKYKITLSEENLYHLKNNNTIINFMKNSSDKNVAKLYKELSSIN